MPAGQKQNASWFIENAQRTWKREKKENPHSYSKAENNYFISTTIHTTAAISAYMGRIVSGSLVQRHNENIKSKPK